MKVAITGGIGSGKSFVCRLLEKQGIEIYDCDKRAKQLIRTRQDIQEALAKEVGQSLFHEGRMDKAMLSRYILSSRNNARTIDDIVHPCVAEDFLSSGMDWMETALLFENGFKKRVSIDFVVVVTADEDTRIERIMERDGLTREKAQEWILCQRSQEDMVRLSDYVITNDGTRNIEEEIDKLLNYIEKYKKKEN